VKLKPQIMKLSEKTISVLKNFSSINQSLLFKQGTQLRTISVMKNILASAEIDEEFPKEFGIYDLNQFLNGLSLHQNAEVDFSPESYAVIKEGSRRTKYYYSDPNVIISPPDKELTLPSEDVCFELDSNQLNQLLKAAAVYQVPDLSAIGNGSTIYLVVRDRKNETSNEYSIEVGETSDTFTMNFKVENIKIIPGKYEVVISKSNISRFVNSQMNVTYHIALEPDSTFG